MPQSRVTDFLRGFFWCFSLSVPTDWDVVVCVELAWPSPSMIDKTPCGGTLFKKPSLVLVCWSLFHSWGWLGLWHGHVGVDFSCGFFGADFCVRIFGCGFFSQIWGCRFFADFFDGLCGFWGADFFCGFFWGCFPAEISHQENSSKNPTEKSSPKILSKKRLFTIHHHTPSGKTQQISSGRLGADAPCGEPFSLRRWLLSGRMNV